MTTRQAYKAAIAAAIIAKLDRKEAKDGIHWHPADAVAQIAAFAELLVNDDPVEPVATKKKK